MQLRVGLVFLLLAGHADAATLTVTNGDDSGAGSLRDTIAGAADGDTIVFDSSVTVVSITGDQIITTLALTIDGGEGVLIQRTAGGRHILDFTDAASLTVRNITFKDSGGQQNFNAPGVLEFETPTGEVTIEGCTFINNRSRGAAGSDPSVLGIEADVLTITDSTFVGNQTTGIGVLNLFIGDGPVTLRNNVFINNSSANYAGAIYFGTIVGARYPVYVDNSVFVGNSSGEDGGAFVNEGEADIVLKNSIFWDNTAAGVGPNFANFFGSTPIESADFNVLGDTTGVTITGTTTNSLLGVDPEILILPIDDGFDRAYRFDETSPLFNAGDCTDIGEEDAGRDNRGVPRPLFGGCDIGAYEFERTTQGVRLATEDAGANCEDGGLRVEVYNDYEGDGAFSAIDDITEAEYVCNGGDGANGANGSDGTNGENGEDGSDGTNGSDGANGMDGSDGGCSASGMSSLHSGAMLALVMLLALRIRRTRR